MKHFIALFAVTLSCAALAADYRLVNSQIDGGMSITADTLDINTARKDNGNSCDVQGKLSTQSICNGRSCNTEERVFRDNEGCEIRVTLQRKNLFVTRTLQCARYCGFNSDFAGKYVHKK